MFVLALVTGVLAFAQVTPGAKKNFNLPAAEAAKSLRAFSAQSGREVIFGASTTEGVILKSVSGNLTDAEALSRLLAGSPLISTEDSQSGAILINRDAVAPPPAQPAPSGAGDKGANPEASSRDSTIELSPFVVRADRDTGYAASQTLAGTRISSDIKNVASQVTVMTAEFLDDIAATTLEDAQLYSLNVENKQEYNSDAKVDSLAGNEDLTGAQRVRGLANATNTRDFFGTFFALDSYNSERFTFNSGPNAILFGLGSPGGIIDQSLKRARFADSTQVKTRVDSYDGYRGSLDVNRNLIPGVLALRGSFVYDHQESWRKPSRDNQRRQYLTATYRPFQKTMFRASFENIRREASMPRNTLIRDYVTPYLAWRDQRMKDLGISDPLDPRLYWATTAQLNPGEPAFTLGGTSPFINHGATQVFLTTGQYDPATPAASLLNRITGTVSASNPIGTVARARGPHEFVSSPDNFNYSLTDESIFPYDINPGGLGTDNRQRGTIYNLALEQQITSNLFVEAAYQHEQYNQQFIDWLRGLDQNLRIDVNRYLPNVVDASGRPVLNPNRGKYYIESWGRGNLRTGSSDQARLTASYKLDFSKRTGWTRWIGTHNFAALTDYSNRTARSQNQRTMLYSNSPDVNIRNPNTRADREVLHRVYLDTPGTGGISYYDASTDVTGLYQQSYGTAQNATVELRPTDLDLGVRAAGSVERVETRGIVFALQSLFWNDRIITTYGRRTDDYRSVAVASPSIGAANPALASQWYGTNFLDVSRIDTPSLDGPLNIDNSGTKETRGLVFRPFNLVSLHYNESSNRSAGSPGRNPNGGFQESSAGDGKDYGFTLDLFRSRMFLKFNWYENAQSRNPSAEFDAVRLRFNTLELRLEQLALENPQVGFAPSSTWDSDVFLSSTPVLSDFSAEGLEITMTANPTPNWRVSLTAAKSESSETNIAQEWFSYYDARSAEYAKFANYAYQVGGNVSQGDETVQSWVNREIFFNLLDRAQLLDGRASLGVRKWRLNFVTNYTFTRSLLKNVGVGGAVRWRDKAVVGFPLTTRADGSRVQDIDRPFYDDGLIDYDGWISYKFKFGSKIRARVQLNVRNIFDSRDLLVQATDTQGVDRLFTVQPPRQFIFSTTFDF